MIRVLDPFCFKISGDFQVDQNFEVTFDIRLCFMERI